RSTIGDRTFWMDASYPYSQPNLLPREMNSGIALLLRDSSFTWQQVNAPESAFNIRARVDAVLQANGTLSGSITSYQRGYRSEEHTSELQSRFDLVCRLMIETKKYIT